MITLRLTTHSALCMNGEEEKREKRLVKLQKLEKEYDEELQKNYDLSPFSLESTQSISGYIPQSSKVYGNTFLEINSYEISNNRLLMLNQEITELKKKLGLETKGE